ncbi:class I SAM-dependent methyltransferase [Sphingomonas arantia]|uniref:Class I SAM-dependent methyltransferase n=1 Tax=Sphingomonas arantia TaxID=1460676 RepID=A0ABW4TTQ4_9SPHN
MKRSTVLQSILDLYAKPNYLEIGVDEGATFRELRAAKKVGVDPRFAFSVAKARKEPELANCEFHEVPSDEFFAKRPMTAAKFDVVFIDGLHTFDQTLRDLLNAVSVLAEGGTILIDDVMPSSYAASLPSLDYSRQFWAATNNPDGSWMGDVFRLVFFVQDYMTSFSYATVEENHGQTVLWREPRAVRADPSRVETISRIEYVDAVMGRAAFKMEPLASIIPRLGKK